VINVRISQTVQSAAVAPSQRVLETALMFGLGVDDRRDMVIVPPTDIPLPSGGIVFITGPSGSGKSTILRLIAEQLNIAGTTIISAGDGEPSCDAPVIDLVGADLRAATSTLSLVGLGDAFVMLRRPSELSDGQRARFNLARSIERAHAADQPCVMMIDEFAATLDRLTARTIAVNIRRWITTTRHTFIAATTHDDLLEPLAPDVLVFKGLGDQVEVHRR
jgi:ABC-type ATPase with predicted acetyltransferase domain